MDVERIFLNGVIKEGVHIEQPHDLEVCYC